MTDHPAIAAKCTPTQIKAFECIAINDTGGHSQKTLDALHRKGLIDYIERRASDAMGRFSWKEPYVPLAIHHQWCQWCSENVSDDDILDAPRASGKKKAKK